MTHSYMISFNLMQYHTLKCCPFFYPDSSAAIPFLVIEISDTRGLLHAWIHARIHAYVIHE